MHTARRMATCQGSVHANKQAPPGCLGSPMAVSTRPPRAASMGSAEEPLPGWWYRMYSTPEHTMRNTYSVPAAGTVSSVWHSAMWHL